MPNQSITPDSCWHTLYRAGGIAALTAGIIFRRNSAVEVSLFSPQPPPDTVSGWFTLLQGDRLLGLTYLHIFDVVNYLLVGLVFLALYVSLRHTSQSRVAIAAALVFLGIAVYLASNTALSMLALSDQYAAATNEAQRQPLLAAGQALLALTRFASSGAHPGSGGYISLLLVAAAGLLISTAMLRSGLFSKAAAYVGIAANTLDLAYCVGYLTVPASSATLAVMFIPAAGLLFMVWHIMIGWRLLRMGREEAKVVPQPA